MLLMFAISLSGYTAAAHASGGGCDPLTMSKMADAGIDMPDCPAHQSAKDQKQDASHTKSGKGNCVNCTHCCGSHALYLTSFSIDLPSVPVAAHNMLPVHGHINHFLFPQFRPPKSAV